MYKIGKNTTSKNVRNSSSGFTTIELITTFALTLVIVVLLLQVIVVLKDVYINKVVVNSLTVKRGIMVEKIMDDFDNKNLMGTAGCVDNNCISFIWEDGSITELKINPDKRTFSYGDFTTELTGGSSYGNASVFNSSDAVNTTTTRRYISINFPVYSTFVKGDYGVHVIYQFDSTKAGIHATDYNTHNVASLFVLKGDSIVTINKKSDYSEKGWTIFYDNAWHDNASGVTVTYSSNGNSVSGVQDVNPTKITYTYTTTDGKVYINTRYVIYKNTNYDYTGNVQMFMAPITGYYRFQAWGAQGGGSSGLGAYTAGTIFLNENDTIYVYVGQGNNTTNNATSFNGGTGDNGGYPGGGATDFRLSNGNWYDTSSLASRIMVAAGSGSGSGDNNTNMGYGGTIVGGNGLNTTGASQISYGSRESTSYALSAFGIGNGGCAGGGGYYGGGGATCVNGAGGGSSYISGHIGCVAVASSSSITPKSGCTTGTTDINCSYHYSGKSFTNTTMIAGNDYMPNHNGTSLMLGNSGNGYASVTYISTSNYMASSETIDYAYQGAPQLFIAPVSGYYKLETWGAQGGESTYTTKYYGGYGGYSNGTIKLNSGDKIYLYVGGLGQSTVGTTLVNNGNGYNGGGLGNYYPGNSSHGGGGGATHISKSLGLISTLSSKKDDIIIVAGGGGGSSSHSATPSYSGTGGSGGGYIGDNGITANATCYNYGLGGTQASAGQYTACSSDGRVDANFPGSFGNGGTSSNTSSSTVGGGGGGYYGGGGGWHGPGGGGSGYIGNTSLLNKRMTCYNCATSADANTLTQTTANVSAIPTTDYAKSGNGYAKVTFVGSTNVMNVSDSVGYSYTGGYQKFTAPNAGYYKFQAWGAQGGTSGSFMGGKGAYTEGIIYLSQSESIYVYVGGFGNSNASVTNNGTYNGGGFSGNNPGAFSYSGGGATDFRLTEGDWNNSTSLNSRIMVAAGGGGAVNAIVNNGGAGGTLTGFEGTTTVTDYQTSEFVTNGGNQANAGESFQATRSGGFGYGIQSNTPGWGGGGGAGYYGGANGHGRTGAGGSSYISGYLGCVAVMSAASSSSKAGCADGNSIRYIEIGSNGSTANSGNHIVEVQAYTFDGTNVALNKTVTSNISENSTYPFRYTTDGNTDTTNWPDEGTVTTIDLGAEYAITKIKVWRYYGDSRTYYNTYVKGYNQDKSKSMYYDNYAIDGIYPETPDGATFFNYNNDITCSYHYSSKIFSNTKMLSGNASMPNYDGTSSMVGNTGNGYAKITYLGVTN